MGRGCDHLTIHFPQHFQPPEVRWTDEWTLLSRPELWLRGPFGSMTEKGEELALLAQHLGFCPLLMQVGENQCGWAGRAPFQACISHSDVGSSRQCFGCMWGSDGLESGENFRILVLQVGSANIPKISG